jgi:hypothetical protein
VEENGAIFKKIENEGCPRVSGKKMTFIESDNSVEIANSLQELK